LDLRIVGADPVRVVAEKYFSECDWRVKVGNGEVGEGVSEGTKDSSGPREGVVAVNTPEGDAVKNVPLHGQGSAVRMRMVGWGTHELVRRLTIPSLPLNLEITHT
jgi:hypothetical protein